MSNKFVGAAKFFSNLLKGGSKTSPTISSTTINVGNLKKNKSTFDKLIKTTDSYVKAAKEKGFEKLSKDLRRAGSKSLQKTDKILRKNKKDGGRMGLKFGSGSDKKLSPKQMKIAKQAGDPNKIEGVDFKKLQQKRKS